MSARLAVVAGAREQRLAAPPEHVADLVPPGSLVNAAAVVSLGDWDLPDGGVKVRWCDDAAGDRSREDERRIATAGSGLWRRSPWPAADALFDLPAPREGAGVAVAGGSAEGRAVLLAAIGARGIPVLEEPMLGAEALEDAFAVALLPPVTAAGALPLESMSVLAAGRMLLVPRTETTFGLMEGVDHLQFGLAPKAADLVESARNHPHAYASLRTWGSFAARRHRASEVYSALLTDLELEGALPGE
jgi:hypothetical protein